MTKLKTFLRKREFRGRLNIGSTLFDSLVRNGTLPRPIYLTDSNRLPLWDEDEVNACIEALLASRQVQGGAQT